jgi:WD40-like Beta Propeller Repeat
MTDERIDALIRRLDVPSDPDLGFVQSTYVALLPRARAARVGDASRIGRLVRDLRLLVTGAWPSTTRPVRILGLVVLLILATMVALAVVGALNRVQPIRNGPLIVSMRGELQAIDVVDGSVRSILPPGESAKGVSRSPDGRLVAFWTIGGGQSHLWVIGVDGRDRRELASDLSLGWTNAVDVWSSDSRFLATEVIVHGDARIIVADVVTGAARVVTPPGLIAHSPLWSPDDRWIAFAEETTVTRSLAVIRRDGSGKRTIGGDIVGVAGPDTWSPDGTWIYFDASGTLGGKSDHGVYRANVAGGFSQLLVGSGIAVYAAYAPASSPDGTLIVFIVPRGDRQAFDLYIANSDGSGSHRLLESATHDGWSADGRYILTEWTPADQPGGLAVITPDGSDFRVLLPFDACARSGSGCTDGVGWGLPRP